MLETILEEYKDYPFNMTPKNVSYVFTRILQFFEANYENFEDYLLLFSDFNGDCVVRTDSIINLDTLITVGNVSINNVNQQSAFVQEKKLTPEYLCINRRTLKIHKEKEKSEDTEVISIRFIALKTYSLLVLEKL